MSALPRPYVQPSSAGPVQRWVARCDCGCGLFEEFVTEAEAAQAMRDAREAHD